MQRFLVSVAVGALLAVSAAAQCINLSSPGTLLMADDELTSAQQALGFTFPNPMGGALAGGYTHCLVSTNGWIVLTDGVGTGNNPGTFSYGNTGNTGTGLGGGAGSFPLLAPYWGDGDTFGALAGEGVFFKASTGAGIPAEVTFIGHRDYAYTAKRNVRVLIHDSGVIQYQYSAGFAVEGFSDRYVGVSSRNGITAVPAETAIGNSGGASSGTSGMCYRTFPTGPVDLEDHEILFVQNGLGGWNVAATCGTPLTVYGSAGSVSIGAGCYDIPGIANDSFYELFPDTAVASAALQGNSMTMSPIASPPGYVGVWNVGGASAFVTPVGATSLAVSDDGYTTITPSIPMSTPFGSFPDLAISHNAIITLGSVANNDFDWSPSGVEFANASGGAFYSWSDYRDDNTTPVASGRIKYHEAVVGSDTILYVTWDAVDRWTDPQGSSPSTLQFQVNLSTGEVNIVWVSINTNTTSIFGTGHLVGFSAPGVSVDPGSVTLSTALPIVTFPDVPPIVPMSMSVDVLPELVLPSGDSVPMTWTVDNVPEAVHIFPLARACNIVFSIGAAFAPGYDLGPLGINIGAAGCTGYLLTADAFVDVSTVSPVGTCTTGPLTFPGTPSLIGLVLSTQAIAIVPAGVYGGNVNDIGGGNGLWTSNAIEQTYNPQ